MGLTPDGDGWTVGTNGVVRLLFSNLNSASPIMISATDASNKAQVPTLVLSVIQRAAYKPADAD